MFGFRASASQTELSEVSDTVRAATGTDSTSGAAGYQRQSLQRHKTGLRLDCRLQNCCHGDVREHQPQSDLRPGVTITEVRDPQQEPHLNSPEVTSGLSDLVTDSSPQYNSYQPILFYD